MVTAIARMAVRMTASVTASTTAVFSDARMPEKTAADDGRRVVVGSEMSRLMTTRSSVVSEHGDQLETAVLFRSLAVRYPRFGHVTDALSPLISVACCHSD